MASSSSSSFFSAILALLLIITQMKPTASALVSNDSMEATISSKIVIGGVVDSNSRIGKEEMVAMQIAMEDCNKHSNHRLVLDVRNSEGEPLQAVLAAQDLVRAKVKAIVGPQTWEETSLVAAIGAKYQVPILSFADSIPKWAMERWPFLIQVSPGKNAQMKAIAAIVESWEWNQVTVIYEDVDSSVSGVVPYLSDALQEVGAEVSHVLAIPHFASSSLLSRELEKLKGQQCRVFVVHLSFPLALQLFERAIKMKMMDKDYVWITTDAFTSLIYSLNASVTSSIEGVVGVKSYFERNDHHYRAFYQTFRRRFRAAHPEEESNEPGVHALRAYDATVLAAALVTSERNKGNQDYLLEKLLVNEFNVLAEKLHFINKTVAPTHMFQIINVVGRHYRELGFWSDGLGRGFSETVGDNVTYLPSMKNLSQVIWPGGPQYTPRGWIVSPNEKSLIIGVPTQSTFRLYVSVEIEDQTNKTIFKGLAIDLFEAVRERLPFDLPCKFEAYDGMYTDLVKQVYLKNFSAAVGNIAIVASRLEYVDFTYPYTEPELVMIVPVRSKSSNKAWLFTKPFSKAMWILIFIVTMYNGFVLLLIEQNHSTELRGSVLNQIGILVWLSFTTLFSLQGSRLQSNLSRLIIVVWLFVALIITQTYTANLSSILTVQGLEPAIDSIEELLRTDATVGHFKISFIANYLEDVLRFKPNNIWNYTNPDDCARDLRNRKIKAVFLPKPIAKIFLARFCSGFIIAKQSFKVGGFGFAFPRGSPLLPHVTEALVKVSESGELKELEEKMLASQQCKVEWESEDDKFRLSPSSFWILFVFTGGTSTIALIVYVIHHKCRMDASILVHRKLWMLMFAMLKRWRVQTQRLSRRFSNVESPRSSATDTSISPLVQIATIDGGAIEPVEDLILTGETGSMEHDVNGTTMMYIR